MEVAFPRKQLQAQELEGCPLLSPSFLVTEEAKKPTRARGAGEEGGVGSKKPRVYFLIEKAEGKGNLIL